jgi:hypothetical protein
MPGGPINGSGGYPFDLLKTTPAATIIVPTMLQIGSDVVDSFTHVTCLYDRFWYNRPDKMTLPICFFYVKSISETTQTETSKKRILLYEPQMKDVTMGDLSDQIRKGVQEVVVDNSVIKPRTYNLEIILPFQPVSKQFGRTVFEAQQIFEAFTEIFAGSVGNLPQTAVAAELYKSANNLTSLAAMFSDNPGAKFINKNSLEAMQEGQKVLTMKMWTGYDYRYAQIVGLDIKKVGTEDDVFRATLQLETRPVLTMTPAIDATKPGLQNRNWAAAIVRGTSKAYSALAAELTGVRAASGQTNSF